MEGQLFIFQLLNSLQLGVLLFLVSAGLTLLLGIMNFVNLAHGSMYMIGAYLGAQIFSTTGSFLAVVVGSVSGTFIVGILVDLVFLRTMYDREHFDQVLVTVGLTLFFNEGVRVIWGSYALHFPTPPLLTGTMHLGFGISYPIYRLFIIAVGVVVGAILFLMIAKTRIGMLVRATASNRTMASAMGTDVTFLSTMVFAAGAALSGLAGVVAAPLVSIDSGMGDPILILALVVIVIGGIGSVHGALFASLLVGFFDTMGRAYFPRLVAWFLGPTVADTVGASVASMLIYIFMALVLLFRPRGLLPMGQRFS